MQMDPNTLKVLKRISANVPQHLQDHLTKVVIDASEEDVARAALSAEFISKKKKKQIQEYLNAGKFRHEETVVNDEVVKEIDAYYDIEIKKAIASGEIPDPANDPFLQERKKRMEEAAAQRLIKSIGGEVTPPVFKSTIPVKSPIQQKDL